eukprot:6175206-Pleurochrysis_carterae.AAC.1
MIAGLGMSLYVVRAGLGSGPNVVITVLMHSLMSLAQSSRPFGTRLHVQLDNTSGENKNVTMVGILAWLVKEDIFAEAAFFCMMKGHTFTNLDQVLCPITTHILACYLLE